MPRYKILVDDVEKAHAALVDSYRLHPHVQRQLNDAPRRQKGEMHTEAESECPDDLPNCRNCGDPEHADTCRAAGHCPSCGIAHGIAPDRLLAAKGYRLILGA